MKNSSKQLTIVAAGLMAACIAQAGDMEDAVAYSLGEFDRVGVSQSVPKMQSGERAATPKQSAQERQLAERKAEFVRRMFWLAMSTR